MFNLFRKSRERSKNKKKNNSDANLVSNLKSSKKQEAKRQEYISSSYPHLHSHSQSKVIAAKNQCDDASHNQGACSSHFKSDADDERINLESSSPFLWSAMTTRFNASSSKDEKMHCIASDDVSRKNLNSDRQRKTCYSSDHDTDSESNQGDKIKLINPDSFKNDCSGNSYDTETSGEVKLRNSYYSVKKKDKSEKNRQSWLLLSLSNSSSVPKKVSSLSCSNEVANLQKSPPIISSLPVSHRPNPGIISGECNEVKTKSKFNPIEKGREIFTDILMAKGRHRNRHQQQSQQQQQQANTSRSKGTATNATAPTQQSQSTVQNESSPTLGLKVIDSEISPTTLHSDINEEHASLQKQVLPWGSEETSTNAEKVKNAERLSKAFSPSDDDVSLIFNPIPTSSYQETISNNSSSEFKEYNCCDSDTGKSVDGAGDGRTDGDDLTGQQVKPLDPQSTGSISENSFPESREKIEMTAQSAAIGDCRETPLQQRLPTSERESDESHCDEENREIIIIDSSETAYNTNVDISLPTTEGDGGSSSDQSETAECKCDRSSETDKQVPSELTNKMGQSNTKNSDLMNSSQSSRCDINRKDDDTSSTINNESNVVPIITVEDFSDTPTHNTSPSDQSPREKEIFYDFPLVNDIGSCPWSISTIIEKDEEENICEDDGFREEYEESSKDGHNGNWHFIDTHQCHDRDHGLNQHNGGGCHDILLKSENASEWNLSTSSPDSGISEPTTTATTKILLIDSCDLLNDHDDDVAMSPRRSPFVRDGNSTDCDESLLQSDDFDFVSVSRLADRYDIITEEDAKAAYNCNLEDHQIDSQILLESISLPDVVVESTSGSSPDDIQILNINGASGDALENVHYIPINIESDEIVLNNDNRTNDSMCRCLNGYNDINVNITMIPEEEEEETEENNELDNERSGANKINDLVNQDSIYKAQLESLQQNEYNLQKKIAELQDKINSLESEMAMKAWNIDKIQGELEAAHKDDTFIRKKLKIVEEEKAILRQNYFESEENLKSKYEELEDQYKELEEKFENANQLAQNLKTQLTAAQSDAEECRQRTERIREEMDEQIRVLQSSLENSIAERKILEDKWQNEFEMLRTQNADREEHLMTDCEWQLRQMQKSCKEKVDKAQLLQQEAEERADQIQTEVEEKINEVAHLRSYKAEVQSLRGLTSEQETSIATLMKQIEEMKVDLHTANKNLEYQIECVRIIKCKCDNTLYDKEREMIKKIDEVRNEAAVIWENKLYTEMTRLKLELESVYIEERRESLDKLQAEHIEELNALTTRFIANEEELRAELEELKEQLDRRNEEFMELREKSDSAILQTRMHLDRADRDYQVAMCREEEKRERLAESLRREMAVEKQEMEERFRERLGQVKDEFAKELQMSTQGMLDQHRRELDQQWEKLTAEKEEAMQDLEARYRKKLDDAENRIRDIELRHQRDLKDLKAMYDAEKASLDKRDMNNANEIESLHRKCRCLTNLFEEMRMRYERREPRPEDLREIAELRSRCEAQERDLYLLTDRLREMQIHMEDLTKKQQAAAGDAHIKDGMSLKKPLPKTIPTNCDVIYEENEERESPISTSSSSSSSTGSPPPVSAVMNSTSTNSIHKDSSSTKDYNNGSASKQPPIATRKKRISIPIEP